MVELKRMIVWNDGQENDSTKRWVLEEFSDHSCIALWNSGSLSGRDTAEESVRNGTPNYKYWDHCRYIEITGTIMSAEEITGKKGVKTFVWIFEDGSKATYNLDKYSGMTTDLYEIICRQDRNFDYLGFGSNFFMKEWLKNIKEEE